LETLHLAVLQEPHKHPLVHLHPPQNYLLLVIQPEVILRQEQLRLLHVLLANRVLAHQLLVAPPVAHSVQFKQVHARVPTQAIKPHPQVAAFLRQSAGAHTESAQLHVTLTHSAQVTLLLCVPLATTRVLDGIFAG
jgi:hypothetical protein